jgi:hypothetical protein
MLKSKKSRFEYAKRKARQRQHSRRPQRLLKKSKKPLQV